MDIFENDAVAYSCGRLKTELFNTDDVTLSVPDFVAQFLFPNPKWRTYASLCRLSCLGLFQALLHACFQLNLLLLTIHADSLIRRGGIIRQLGLLLSKLRLPFTLERIKISKLRFLAEYKYTLNELLVKKCFPIRLIVCEI